MVPGGRCQCFAADDFLALVGRTDRWDLWGPWQDPYGNLLVLLGGRLAMDEEEWLAAEQIPGEGGLACKAIAKAYRELGRKAFASFNGNFGIFLYDRVNREAFLVSDRLGAFLIYGSSDGVGSKVFGSHPDLVADFSGTNNRRDPVSMAEFLDSGRLTFPFTFYQDIKALEFGCIHRFEFDSHGVQREPGDRVCEWKYQGGDQEDVDGPAQALAEAFHNSVRRRSLKRLGDVGVGLSGGLDSRVILAAASGGATVKAFSLLNEENEEWQIARSLAEVSGVHLEPIVRDYDYYGRTARDGVRLSAGMGCLMNNHYLGAADSLKAMGIENLLTGCYCDYVFKGLALNTRTHPISRQEVPGRFELSFYRSGTALPPAWRKAVQARQQERYPFEVGAPLDNGGWWEVERLRVFPLAYEGDLAQRIVPQRCMPWYVPAADNDLLEVYMKIPPGMKLNNRVFRRMVQELCGDNLCRIPDNNTGAPVHSGDLTLIYHRYRSALLNRVKKMVSPGITSRGSWPNWEYYAQHSQLIQELWSDPIQETASLFDELLGFNPFIKPLEYWKGSNTELFLRLLTLKLWMEQRAAGNSPGF